MINLNKDSNKERLEVYRKVVRQMLLKAPREDIIEVAKKRKILKRDWGKEGEVYVEVKSDSRNELGNMMFSLSCERCNKNLVEMRRILKEIDNE